MTRSSRRRARTTAADDAPAKPRVEVQVARIGAAAIVLSAILAAAIASWSTGSQQQRQERSDERQEEIAARGAARVLFSELLQTGADMAVLANDRIFRRFDRRYEIEIPPSDLRLIAASLSGYQWGDVQTALLGVRQLDTFVNTQIERGRTRLTKGEACYALIDLRAIRVAAEALSDLAQAPENPSLPAPLDCIPKPGPVPPIGRWQDS